MGRETIIDPQIAYKLLNGKQDEIYYEFNEESVAKSHIPSGMMSLLASVPEFAMPGVDYLKELVGSGLDESITHLG